MSSQNQSERLRQLAGSDVAKQPSITNQVLRSVLDELQEEKEKEAKERARGLLRQAIELERKKKQAVKEFEAALKKFDKELGKLLNQLEQERADQPEEVEQSEDQS